jgi:anti-sigma B factor antagonist
MVVPQDGRISATPDDESASSVKVWDGKASSYLPTDEWPRLNVRMVEGRSVVDVLNAEALFDPGVIRDLSIQLHHLIEGGHTRVLLNLSGVRYMSSDVLGTLALLHRRARRQRGRIGLIGLEPLLRDMVRICSLEPIFDIYADENEALHTSAAAGKALSRE